MTLFPGSIYGGMAQLGASTKAAAAPWYLAGGIAAANCIAAYAPKGAADLAASYVNLATPGTNNAAPGTAPTWDAVNGWTFNGINQYLTTGLIPARAYSMIIRFTKSSASVGVIAGMIDTSPANTRYNIQTTGDFLYFNNSGAGGQYAYASTTGVACIAGETAYINGIAIYTIGLDKQDYGFDINIGCRNLDGSPANIELPALAVHQISAYLDAQVSTLPALVWAVATSTLTAAGSIGKYVMDLIAALVSSLSGSVEIISPVSIDGKGIQLVAGDDYNATDGRSLDWVLAGWPA